MIKNINEKLVFEGWTFMGNRYDNLYFEKPKNGFWDKLFGKKGRSINSVIEEHFEDKMGFIEALLINKDLEPKKIRITVELIK